MRISKDIQRKMHKLAQLTSQAAMLDKEINDYFESKGWVDYVLRNSKLPDTIYKGRETWMMKLLDGNKIEPFKKKLRETFTKQYMCIVGETEFLNGVFLSILEINKIYNEDCLEGMKKIDDKSIDAIITDLPYGQTSRNKWDSVIPFKPLWKQYERIIKDNGAIILFANGMFTADLMQSNRKLWKYNLIWEKTQPTGFLNAKKMPLRSHEDICIFYKKLPTYNPQKTTGHPRKVSKAEHKTNCKETITASAAQINYYESHFYVKTREKMLQRQLEINKCQKDIATENNEVDDKTPVIIIEETYYIDMDVPGSKPFKSYMDARLITSTNSAQYKLKSEYELDDSGIYMIDGRYACAIGSYYTTEIGTKFDVVMKSGEVIPCILADCKADEHTDNLGQYTISNDSIVEFIVHSPTLIPNISNRYVDIANEESSDIQADGEDYYVALRNLENKYGYDEDIVTIIRMCNQWQNSFHKMQGRCNEFIMATTSYEARIKSILENKTEDE